MVETKDGTNKYAGLVPADLNPDDYLTWSRILRTTGCPTCYAAPGRHCRYYPPSRGKHHKERTAQAELLFRCVVQRLSRMNEGDLLLYLARQKVEKRAQRFLNGL